MDKLLLIFIISVIKSVQIKQISVLFTVLNFLILFCPDVPTVTPSSMISSVQDKVVLEFRSHLSSCGDSHRFSQLLLRMAPLKAFQAKQLEEIFFSGLIGSVQIDSVIPYIIKMEDEFFNGHLTGKIEEGSNILEKPEFWIKINR